MRTNRLKHGLREGKCMFGTMLKEAPSPTIIDILALAGFDFFVVDMEHALYSMGNVGPLLQYARKLDITAVVRIPVLNYSYVAKTLDLGAEGIWVPHLDTPEEARSLVSFAKYPPEGRRGAAVPSFRLRDYQEAGSAAEYYRRENEEVLLIAQIESGTAVKNTDGIVALDGIDVAMIGTQDLSLDLGFPGQGQHPEVQKAVQQVVAACERHGKVAGNHLGSIDQLRAWIKQGMRMITYGYETSMLLERSREVLAALKG